MRLTFTKRAGKYDELVIERDGRLADPIPCPKQGIIPHDMVHYAVESSLRHRGFLGMIADGSDPAWRTRGGEREEAMERLVEAFHAEMWGRRVPAGELLAVYEHACSAHGHLAVPVSEQDVEAIRSRLDQLSQEWALVEENRSVTLEM
jgi:predicted small metal-binding protein